MIAKDECLLQACQRDRKQKRNDKNQKNFSSEKAKIIMKFFVTQFQMRKSKMK